MKAAPPPPGRLLRGGASAAQAGRFPRKHRRTPPLPPRRRVAVTGLSRSRRAPGGAARPLRAAAAALAAAAASAGALLAVSAFSSAPAAAQSNAGCHTAGYPYPPGALTLTAGDHQIQVQWSEPGLGANADQITGYAVAYKQTTQSASAWAIAEYPTSTSYTITGLTNGTSYDIKVAAYAPTHQQPPSSADPPPASLPGGYWGCYSDDYAGTPYGKPSAPTLTGLAAGACQITATWTAPDDDGGASVTGYRLEYDAGTTLTVSDGTKTEAIITGLTAGTSYAVTVQARNSQAQGWGPFSNSLIMTPASCADQTTVGSLQGFNAEPGDSSITVSFTYPDTDWEYNGQAILPDSSCVTITATSPGGQTHTWLNNAACQTHTSYNPSEFSHTITGLTNGTTYDVEAYVTLTNGGLNITANSPTATDSATPRTAPPAPTINTATADCTTGDKPRITVNFTTPADNGGAPLTGYTLEYSDGTTTYTSGRTANLSTNTALNGVRTANLTVDTTYTITAAVRNVAGDSPTATTTATTPETCAAATNSILLTVNTASIAEDAASKTVLVTADVQTSQGAGGTFAENKAVKVKIGRSSDSATEGTDYATITDKTITINAGADTATTTFTLNPTDDIISEGDETITITGTYTHNNTTHNTTGSPAITITDNDTDRVIALSVSPGSIAEDAATKTFTVTADVQDGSQNVGLFATDKTVAVKIGRSSDSATEGTDYATITDKTITINAGADTATTTFTLNPTDDIISEGDETITITGTYTHNNTTHNTTGSPAITITDNDTDRVIALSVSPGSIAEDAATKTFTVTADVQDGSQSVGLFATDKTVAVKIGRSSDSATEGTDYATITDRTITINAGADTATTTFTLNPTDDIISEGDETITITGTYTTTTPPTTQPAAPPSPSPTTTPPSPTRRAS